MTAAADDPVTGRAAVRCRTAGRPFTRRALLGLMAAAAAARNAEAQEKDSVRRVGVLVPYSETTILGEDVVGVLRTELKERGWIDGKNIQINARRRLGDAARIRIEAQTLAKWSPDVIFCANAILLAAVRRETDTIPIVFVQVADPVGQKFVTSLERPGGNVTGVANYDFSMADKWLTVLRDVSPGLRRVALIYNLESALANPFFVRSFGAAGRSLKIDVDTGSSASDADIKDKLASLSQQPGGGFVVLPEPFSTGYRQQIIAQAAANKVPGIYPFRHFAVAGGLCSYGINVTQAYKEGAEYIARILNGAAPAELPVRHPEKFELVINLKAAEAIDLAIPASVLARADEVIK